MGIRDNEFGGFRRPSIFDLTEGEGSAYTIDPCHGGSVELRSHDDLYLSVAESTQNFLFLVNRNLDVVYVNATGARQFNLAPDQMVGKHLSTFLPTAAFERRQASIGQVFRTGVTLSVEEKFLFPTGVMWVSSHLVPVRGHDGDVDYVLETLLDITKRKLAEEELAASQFGLSQQYEERTARVNREKLALREEIWALSRSQELVEIENDLATKLVACTDMTRCFELVLAAVARVDGVDGGALYVVDEKSGDLHLLVSKGQGAAGTGSPAYHGMETPLSLLVMQGVPFYKNVSQETQVFSSEAQGMGLVELAVLPIRPRKRVVAAVHLFSESIDELDGEQREALGRCVALGESALKRMLVESRAQKGKDRYRVLFERAEDALFVLDGVRERILDCNVAAEAATGYTRQELRRLSPLELHPRGERELAAACMGTPNASAPGGALATFNFLNKDGRIFPVEIIDTKVQMGSRVLTLRVVRDTSEREAIEDKKRIVDNEMLRIRTREAVSRLTGGVAHVFNNLLVGIIGNADLAQTTLPDQSEALPFVLDIISTADQMSEVIRGMLQYHGDDRVERVECDLNNLVEDVARLVEISLPPGVSLKRTLDERIPRFLADASQVRLILASLIQNAVEACDDGSGTISVSTSLMEMDFVPGQSRFAVIDVTDTGGGMDEETLGRIFEPFYSTKFTGRGLGLSAVEGIVQVAGGTISASSRLGEGSVLQVLLPIEIEGKTSATQDGSKVLSSAP